MHLPLNSILYKFYNNVSAKTQNYYNRMSELKLSMDLTFYVHILPETSNTFCVHLVAYNVLEICY